MKKIRFAALVLAAVLVLSALASCGKKNDEAAAAAAAAEEAKARELFGQIVPLSADEKPLLSAVSLPSDSGAGYKKLTAKIGFGSAFTSIGIYIVPDGRIVLTSNILDGAYYVNVSDLREKLSKELPADGLSGFEISDEQKEKIVSAFDDFKIGEKISEKASAIREKILSDGRFAAVEEGKTVVLIEGGVREGAPANDVTATGDVITLTLSCELVKELLNDAVDRASDAVSGEDAFTVPDSVPDEIKEKLAGLPEEAEKAIAQIKEKLASAAGSESAAEAVLVVDHETKLLLGATFGVRESEDGAVTPVLVFDRRTEDGNDIARICFIGSGEEGTYGCVEIKKTSDETRTEGDLFRWGLYINGSEAVSFTSSEGGKKIVFESASIPGLGGLASALGGQSGKLTFTLESFDTGFDDDQKDLECRDIFSDEPESGYGLSQIVLALSAFGIGNGSDSDPSSFASLIPSAIR